MAKKQEKLTPRQKRNVERKLKQCGIDKKVTDKRLQVKERKRAEDQERRKRRKRLRKSGGPKKAHYRASGRARPDVVRRQMTLWESLFGTKW